MMQAPDFGNLHDPAQREPLERPPVLGILLEREVSPRAVIVRAVAGQDAAELFHEGSLPGPLDGREHVADPHAPHTLPERVAVDRVAIAEQVSRRGVVGDGVHDLLGRPGGYPDEEHTQARGGEGVVSIS